MAKVVSGIAGIVAIASLAGAQTGVSVQGNVGLPPLNAGLSASVGAVAPPTLPTLEKGDSTVAVPVAAAVVITPAAPRLTPRGMGVSVYPQPAVTEGGIAGPYGQGLAAAAPVGTPYLRSPAFAGPPIIYMPQTVSRVLLPGVTPYPANVMYPPQRYVYSSAPFLRTDIYVNLPYGTFYWPQGYAGTTPVEPQVPAYALAPSTAVYSNEASYSTQRYAPGIANQETLNPLAVATPAAAAEVVRTEDTSTIPSGASASVSAAIPPSAPIAETPPPLQPLQPFPSLPTGESAPSSPPSLPGALPSPAPAMPSLPTGSDPAPAPPALPSAPPALPSAPSALPGAPPALPSAPPALPSIGGPAPGSAPPALPSLPGSSSVPALPAAPPAGGSGLPALPGPSASVIQGFSTSAEFVKA